MNDPVIIFAPGWSSLPKLEWNPLLNKLENQGHYIVYSLDYVNHGMGPISEIAKAAMQDIDHAYGDEIPQEHMVIIGHSMGALVGRYMIQKLGFRPAKYISLAGPHHGSPFSRFAPRFWPNSSAADMAPGSPFLEDLDWTMWPSEVDAMTISAMVDPLVPDATLQPNVDTNWRISRFPNEKIPWTGHASLLLSQRTFWEIYGFIEYR